MALFKPAKKRINQNRTHGPSSEDVESSALHNSGRLGCSAKTRRPLCCKAMAEFRHTTPISSPGQADEVSKFSLIPKLKLLKNMETGIHANTN